MKCKSMRMRWTSLAILPAALLSSCGQSIDVATWKEEVQLHDGKMIVVERIARAHPRGWLSQGGSRGADIDFEIKYEPLGVHWKGTKQQGTFEIFDGVAYVTTTVGNQVKYCEGKSPSTLPIVVMKQQGQEWVEVEASKFPTHIALRNLYGSYWGNKPSEDAKGLITWQAKAVQDGYPTVERKLGNPKRAYTVDEFYRENNLTCARFQPKN
jgi:hypothetical protein